MKHAIMAIALLMSAAGAQAVGDGAVLPFEREGGVRAFNEIDLIILAMLEERGIEAARLSSDAVFLRRVYLDVIGTVPKASEVRRFLDSRERGKRAKLIDSLLEREEFADYWSLKWGDVLRVKAEFPINLWPNAVQAYHRWIRDAVRNNMPYDQFARELLTSSGSNFRVPQVNFYRALQGKEPSAIAQAVALSFMGVRIENWSAERRSGMEAFFSRVAYKETAEWKEEIVHLDPTPCDDVEAVFPDGRSIRIPAGEDPRYVFADWLINPENPWFTQNIANRVWAWLMGRGIMHEPDDIRPDNPAINIELLALLEEQLVSTDYDIKNLFRLILNSRTYQQSPIPRSNDPQAEALFAHYIVRRLDAEVLVDAFSQILGIPQGYSSAIPEPFTNIPEHHRSITLADGSITSQFLEIFGRPARDTGLESERNNEPTDAQRLHLLNSSQLQRAIRSSARLQGILKTTRGKRRSAITALYMHILSRYPTEAERGILEDYSHTDGLSPRKAAQDLVWALINTKEFLYRH
jgi:uncharacterized protein DUF1553/uncharacterized protein DUF1549